MKKLFDRQNKRLVFIRGKANSSFWENHWDIDISDFPAKVRQISKYNFVVRITKKYLKPSDGPILEGGCGIGQNVYALTKAGFKCMGIDYTEKTVENIKKYVPEIDVRYGDVRNLEFQDGCFAGYWSLGVIEHSYDGYDDILHEMKRTIAPGGYLFLTFPTMSFLRNLKARIGKYPVFDEANANLSNFYQFALDSSEVKRKFEAHGFKFIKAMNRSGIKGLKDEVSLLQPFLQKIFDGKNLFFKSLNYLLNPFLSPYAGHMKFMVFQKV